MYNLILGVVIIHRPEYKITNSKESRHTHMDHIDDDDDEFQYEIVTSII